MIFFLSRLPAFLLLVFGMTAQAQINLPDGDYYIVSQSSYKPMTAYIIDHGEMGVAQFQWSAQREPAQVWTLRREGNACTLRSRQYGGYLVIPGASQDAGVAATILAGPKGRRQKWRLVPYADAFGLVAQHSGQALGVRGSLTEEGTDYLQWQSPAPTDNERFLFFRVDAGSAGRHMPDRQALAKSRYDNQARRYHLVAQVPGGLDADRMRRFRLMDAHPSGLYVARGETLAFDVAGLERGRDALVAMIGPANGFFEQTPAHDPAAWVAQPGHNVLTAPRSGMLYFRYVDSGIGQQPLPPVNIAVVQGGRAVPFYIVGQTSASAWRDMLQNSTVPYVEMVGSRALITVRREMYDHSSRADPAMLLGYLDQVIGLHDQFSGLDGSTPIDQPSPLRLHYQQDDVSSAKSIENVHMYAGNHFIGMPAASALTLLDEPWATDPWGLWHETGHTYQQSDWTWEALAEVTVNLYALHAQERLGLPSRLDEEYAYDWAALYLTQDQRNFNDDASFPEHSAVWVRLVMFEQLRNGLGDDFYPRLHQYYRRHPLNFAEPSSEDTPIQHFIYRSSLVARVDLSSFFSAWGLPIGKATKQRISALKLPVADADLIRIR